MKSRENVVAGLLAVLAAVTIYGIYDTGRARPTSPAAAAATAAADSAIVDESALIAAEEIVQLPTTPDEVPFARDALRLADQEMDMAFAQAVRDAAARPPITTPESRTIASRLDGALQTLAADEAHVKQLTTARANADVALRGALDDQLALANAQAELDQDQVDDARGDLIRVGGDPQGRTRAMIQEHETASKRSDSLHVAITASNDGGGLLRRGMAWMALSDKKSLLRAARAAADSSATQFSKQHDALDDTSAHASATAARSAADLGHDSAVALVRSTEKQAVDQKARSALDQRADNQRQLARTYGRWIRAVNGQQRMVLNRALSGVLVIVMIALLGLFVDRWIERGLVRMRMERRRMQTLKTTIRVSLQVAAVLLILLVVFGVPNNFGTFLGLTGAGLTVALQDFIIGFFGWFMLMGRNGIRIGDLVEVNGVTGEVVELGLFHTVLLETGTWTDSNHPTGRRVTFTNSFAIQGHYFNFSTSSQWLWDEISVVVPDGRDPHPIVEAIRAEVAEATAESARLAGEEWEGATHGPSAGGIVGAPSVHIKPVIGGTEIEVRYITRAPDRAALRSRIYHTAVELLGEKALPAPAPHGSPGAR